MTVHQTSERLEMAEHAQHSERKRTALIIILLAVALALTEMAGKEAQFASIEHNINSSDLYSFYQAKTIRAAVLRTATESVGIGQTDLPEARDKQLERWKAEIARLDSEPSTGQGRKELLERAKALEEDRDRERRSYHQLEISSAGLQLAIVIASAAAITEVALLELVSVCLGIAAVALALIGYLAPHLLQL